MDPIEILRWAAAATGITAALIVSGNFGRLVTGWGFVIFLVSSTSWVIAGVLQDEPALTVQNVVLTGINAFGVYRWLLQEPVDRFAFRIYRRFRPGTPTRRPDA